MCNVESFHLCASLAPVRFVDRSMTLPATHAMPQTAHYKIQACSYSKTENALTFTLNHLVVQTINTFERFMNLRSGAFLPDAHA